MPSDKTNKEIRSFGINVAISLPIIFVSFAMILYTSLSHNMDIPSGTNVYSLLPFYFQSNFYSVEMYLTATLYITLGFVFILLQFDLYRRKKRAEHHHHVPKSASVTFAYFTYIVVGLYSLCSTVIMIGAFITLYTLNDHSDIINLLESSVC